MYNEFFHVLLTFIGCKIFKYCYNISSYVNL